MQKLMTIAAEVAFVGAVLLSGGCQNDNSSMNDFFPQEEERSIDQFVTAQAASGARADATLQSYHFDGPRLNSLGEAKLDLLLKDDDTAEPVVVYVNLKSDDSDSAARKESVTAYLQERGLTKEQVALKDGANPDVSSAAAPNLSRMSKLDTGSSSSTSSGSSYEAPDAGSSSGGSAMTDGSN